MICRPCRDSQHDRCIDKMREPDPVDTRGVSLLPRSSTCFCQHKVNVVVEPEEGDPHDC